MLGCIESIQESATLDHFFDLIFPDIQGSLAMVFNTFVDNSKDSHTEKVVVSGIFIGEKEKWASLRSRWQKILTANNMRYFKAAEYYGLRGEFGQVQSESKYPAPTGREAAKNIFDELEDVIRNSAITSLGIVIPVQDYNDVLARPEAQGKLPSVPYLAALNSGFFETVKAIRTIPGQHMVAFVHDDDTRFPLYREAYLDFRKKNPKTAKLMGGFIPLNNEDHPELQAADLAANATCNFAKQWLDNPGGASLQRLKDSMFKIGIWEKDYIISVLIANSK